MMIKKKILPIFLLAPSPCREDVIFLALPTGRLWVKLSTLKMTLATTPTPREQHTDKKLETIQNAQKTKKNSPKKYCSFRRCYTQMTTRHNELVPGGQRRCQPAKKRAPKERKKEKCRTKEGSKQSEVLPTTAPRRWGGAVKKKQQTTRPRRSQGCRGRKSVLPRIFHGPCGQREGH